MKKSVITSVLIAGLLSSQLAIASKGGSGKFMHFFDANNDGTVTMDEFDEAARTRFTRMDSDKNGILSQEEFHNYIKLRRMEHKAKKLELMDSNKDGKVSESEYVTYKAENAKRKFAQMDKDKDGNLTAEEMKSCGKRRHGKGKYIFKRMDQNGDGQVTREESYAAWSAWFARIDANGDKVVTSDEVNTFRQMKRETHGK